MMNGEDAAVVSDQAATEAGPVSAEATPPNGSVAAPEPAADPAAAAPAESPAPVAEVATDSSATDDAPKRRVQLNPTVSPEQQRAIPTYEPEPGETPAVDMSAVAAEFPNPSAEPISLPPKDSPLEANLEAEINAAMAGTVAAAPVEGQTAAPALSAIPASEDEVVAGAQLKAKVQSVSADNVFCEVGFRVPAMLPVKQFPQGKQPRIGEEFLVIVEKFDAENGAILVNLPKATRRPKGNWEELSVGQIVECVVNKTNKGGLEVTISNMRAFLPASQVDLGFVSSLDPYVGQRFAVQITEVNPAKRNLVVSRRVLLIQERKEAATTFWQGVEVGQQFNGTVKTLKDYGAFIDLGGVDGFLHVGEMSWTRIKHPSDILQEGSQVDVVILSLDREKQKIGLGMRQLAQNPWALAADKYAVGRTATGKVTRVTDFGAFVELEPGVEGLIHISELDHRRVKRVADVLNVGQEVQAQVLEVVPDRQRISLSLKALKEKPEEPKDEDLSPGKGQAYDRKRKEPLRGGTGSVGGGGLFGNPGDFGR
jgi:predicted RNA-binding protein with RPS1 domain